MSLGTFTFVNVSPVIGYMVTQRLSAGVGVLYQYVQDKRFSPPLTRNDYGGSIFARYAIVPPVFLPAEYEYLNFEYADTRQGFNSFMAGGGIAQPISRNASFVAVALYNFSYQPNSPGIVQPYNSPWVIRVGITAGF